MDKKFDSLQKYKYQVVVIDFSGKYLRWFFDKISQQNTPAFEESKYEEYVFWLTQIEPKV